MSVASIRSTIANRLPNAGCFTVTLSGLLQASTVTTPASCARSCGSNVFVAPPATPSSATIRCQCASTLPPLTLMRVSDNLCSINCVDGSVCGGYGRPSTVLYWSLYNGSASQSSSFQAPVNQQMPSPSAVQVGIFAENTKESRTPSGDGSSSTIIAIVSIVVFSFLIAVTVFGFCRVKPYSKDRPKSTKTSLQAREEGDFDGSGYELSNPTLLIYAPASGTTSRNAIAPSVMSILHPEPRNDRLQTLGRFTVSSHKDSTRDAAFDQGGANYRSDALAADLWLETLPNGSLRNFNTHCITSRSPAPSYNTVASLPRGSIDRTTPSPIGDTETLHTRAHDVDKSLSRSGASPSNKSMLHSLVGHGLLATAPPTTTPANQSGSTPTPSPPKKPVVLGAMPHTLAEDLTITVPISKPSLPPHSGYGAMRTGRRSSMRSDTGRGCIGRNSVGLDMRRVSVVSLLRRGTARSSRSIASPTESVMQFSGIARKRAASSLFMETLAINAAIESVDREGELDC
ncbi:hypothetical protein BC830DRAFT_1128209, partial [Chytriomyces sp. MP71]